MCYAEYGQTYVETGGDKLNWENCLLKAAPSPAPTTAIPTISAAPTMDVCSSVGESDYEGRTLYCFEAGGEIHNVLRVEDEQTTCRYTDENSCPEGFDIWVPRSYAHLEAVYDLARDWWPPEDDWRALSLIHI